MLSDKDYGCLFCITGREELIAKRIMDLYPDISTVVATKEKPRFVHGKKITERVLLMPGYIFFEAPPAFDPFRCLRIDGVIRVLSADRLWQLQGDDRAFVRWLFDHDGLLETSKAYRENDRVRIVSGPLKDLEGSLCRVNRHNQRGQVKLKFNSQTFMVWLNFDMVEPESREDVARSIDSAQ